jgi:glycosyltransferase involved in cell wall biosynthesis
MGGQKGIYLFLKYFSRYCSVVCYTVKKNVPEGGETFKIKNVFSDHRLRYINLLYFFKLRKDFRKEQITHLILEHPYYGWLGILLKKFTQVKLIVHSHNIESLRFRTTGKWWWSILWWYERYAHRRADLNFFISEEDRQYAIKKFSLSKEKCSVITYGTEQQQNPSAGEKLKVKKEICRIHDIDEHKHIILYNGSFDYPPNRKALDLILEEINPWFSRQNKFPYCIIICGSKLPASYYNLAKYKSENILYAGFVNNIDIYFKAADIFINPVIEGGGIKTKLVEALAANCSAVSFATGASGVPVSVTGKKLQIVYDGDIKAFAQAMENSIHTIRENIPEDFFDHFYWDNIAKKAVEAVSKLK